ncbi:MAG TPA: phosphatase PAP2 family protein [Phycisphaerae bacterium]
MHLTEVAEKALPALWYENAPSHFDLRVAWWIKALAVALCALLAVLFLDQRVAVWADAHRIPDLMHQKTLAEGGGTYGDSGREMMFLEQWGQGICSVIVVIAVALLDPAGRRRALAIAMACLITVALTHLMKDIIGRSRPFVAPHSQDGSWVWGGPTMGFHKGSAWGSFPSAHTTAAFALASALAWFYPRGRALFMALAVVTATQRVWHTAHYLSDVIAGMGIGVFVARVSLGGKLAGRLIAMGPPVVQRWWLKDHS